MGQLPTSKILKTTKHHKIKLFRTEQKAAVTTVQVLKYRTRPHPLKTRLPHRITTTQTPTFHKYLSTKQTKLRSFT